MYKKIKKMSKSIYSEALIMVLPHKFSSIFKIHPHTRINNYTINHEKYVVKVSVLL